MGRMKFLESLRRKMTDSYYCRKLESGLLLNAEVEEILDTGSEEAQIDILFSSSLLISIDRQGNVYCNDPKFWDLLEEGDLDEEELHRNFKNVLLGKFLTFITDPEVSMSQKERATLAIARLRSSDEETALELKARENEVEEDLADTTLMEETDQEKKFLPFRRNSSSAS